MDFLPDAQAAEMLHRLFHHHDEHCKNLDDEIMQLKSRIHSLKARRAVIAKSRNIHRALLPPIRKLPPEILGQMFVQYFLASIHCSAFAYSSRRGSSQFNI